MSSENQVFLSWSGEVAKTIGEAFEEAIDNFFDKKCFFSPLIKGGDDWARKLSRALQECSFAIVFLTPESFRSEWVLWEAGALWKQYSESMKICPVLICVPPDKIPKPLKAYQYIELRAERITRGDQEEIDAEAAKKSCVAVFDALSTAFQTTHNPQKFAMKFEAAWNSMGDRVLRALDRADRKTQGPLEAQIEHLREQVSELTDEITDVETKSRILWNAVEGPAYLMDHEYTILSANIAAQVLFGIGDRTPLTFEKFWEHVRPQVINADAVEKNMTRFQTADPPRFDFEPIQYEHPSYGRIEIHKTGVALPRTRPEDGLPVGWVVVFNFESVEHSREYYEAHKIAVKAAVQGHRQATRLIPKRTARRRDRSKERGGHAP